MSGSVAMLAVAIMGSAAAGAALARWTGAEIRTPTAVVTAAVAGVPAGVVSGRLGSAWWLPALIVWAATLAVAAAVDARTRRVPTGVVRTGGVVTAAALVAAALATQDYRSLAVALVAVIVSAVVLALCWRFAGVGWGDVRLAAAGGLGMGHATRSGITTGIAVFVVITFVQAVYTYAKTRDRKAHFPLGPALAAGFLAAAAA